MPLIEFCVHIDFLPFNKLLYILNALLLTCISLTFIWQGQLDGKNIQL